MDRTSTVHYIAPSSISIIPNANGSPNDLAVYVAAKAKIKVYSRGISELGIDPVTNSFREWTLSGRNRRLADLAKPYTVYARLSKTDATDGYIVFAPKEEHGGEWTDIHSYVTNDGESVLYVENGLDVRNTDTDYWYVKLGDVSLPSGGERTMTLDTGILGTDQFNADWYIDPDRLPLRVEIGCTIDDEDAGPTPYVYWGKSVVLSAVLVEGWENVNVERFDHWGISRNTGNTDADAEWNTAAQQRIALVGSSEVPFSDCGQITLSHARGVGDDFNGAVATTFIVTAYGRPEPETASSDSSDSHGSSDSSSSGEPEMEVLASASITILAETAEKYELVLSTAIVSYSPQTGGYNPSAGVTVRVRATDQRGEVFTLTRGQFDNAGLSLDYAPVGSESWTPLTVENAPSAVATAVIDTATAFAAQKSMNVRLVRIFRSDSSDSSSSDDGNGKTELALATIAFVRDGEDSKEREWVFFRSTSAVSFGNASSAYPLPSLITLGEVNPDGAAESITSDRNQDGWVPAGWWDEMHGADSTYKYEYGAYRDYAWSDDSTSSGDEGGKRWGPFSNPVLWHQYSDGSNGSTPIQLFKWFGRSDTVVKPTVTTTQWNTGTSQALGGWSKTAPDKVANKDLYMSQNTLSGEGAIDSNAWTTPVRISGEDGNPGADAKEREWIYIGKSAQASFTGAAHPANITSGTAGGQSISGNDRYTTDDFVPNAWSDTAIAIDDTNNKFVYASCRDWNKTTEKWDDFQNPVLWSNWGVQGIDGDGVQYVYKLFDHELTDNERTSNIPTKPASQNAAGEWIPTGWSDDPQSPTLSMPFCYCSVIKEINGTWGSFEKLGLWSKWSKDGSPWVADLDNEMDSVSCEDTSHPVSSQTVSTNVSLHFGTEAKAFSITQVKRKYGSANGSTSTWSSSASSATYGVYPSWSGGALTMNYGTSAVITGKDIIEITVQATEDSSITRTLTFIVNGIVGDVYNLSPSVGQVNVSSAAGSAYLWCGYTKKVNGAVTEYSLTPDTSTGLHIDSRYNIYFRRRIRAGKTVGGTTYNSETWESTYRLLTYSTNDHPTMLTSLDVTVYNSVEFCLCTSTGATSSSLSNVIDRETVPVLTDGEDGSNLEMYGLNPSRTSADFHSTDGTSYTPTYIDVTCGYTKTTGDGTTSYAWPASEGTILINGSTYYIVWRKYDANGNIVATFDGAQTLGWDRSYANSSDPTAATNDMGDGLIRLMGGLRIKNTCAYSAIEFAIANAYARNIDSEEDIIARITVPIHRVSDGEKGDDGEIMNIIADYNGGDVSLLTFSRNYAGANITSVPSTFTLRLMSGGTEVSSLPSGCSWYKKQGSGSWSQLSSSKNVSRTQSNILTDFSNGTYTTVTYGVGTSSSNILYAKLLTMRWEIQRMLVPAGEWSSSVTYTRTDTTTPLVCYNVAGTTEYWYLVADSSQGDPPYEGSAYWKKCTEFDVVLTKMLFAEFARLGSFIVYGDYFLSQYGTLVGPSSETAVTASNVNTSYSAFTPIVLNGNSVSNGIIVVRITFYATAGTTMKATIAPSSESNYDFAAIGLLGTASSPEAAMWLETASASSIKNGTEGTHFLKAASGTSSVQATLTISTTGTYFIDIAYAKDSSTNSNNDNATFTFQKQSGTVTPDTMRKVVGTSGMTYEGYCQSSVPYGWFDPDDPMAETKPDAGYKFRPVKCFNALTGEEWSANGNVHTDASGNVILKNALFANSLNANTLDTQSVNGRRIHIEGGVFNVYDDNGNIGLRIGWDDTDNGAPYIILNNADGSKSWKVTYDGIVAASASFTQDTFNSVNLNAAGGSASSIHNNTNAATYYHFLAAKHTVTGVFSNENPSGSGTSTTWQTYRSNQNNRYFTTNSKTYVISSSGSSYRIPDGYYISQAEIVQTGNVYSRYLYSADNGFVAEVGVVYYILDGSIGMWTDANGNNGRKQFDPSRYITR